MYLFKFVKTSGAAKSVMYGKGATVFDARKDLYLSLAKSGWSDMMKSFKVVGAEKVS